MNLHRIDHFTQGELAINVQSSCKPETFRVCFLGGFGPGSSKRNWVRSLMAWALIKPSCRQCPTVFIETPDITPLARSEWICWIESAKKAETRSRRIDWGCSSLNDGKRRPCC